MLTSETFSGIRQDTLNAIVLFIGGLVWACLILADIFLASVSFDAMLYCVIVLVICVVTFFMQSRSLQWARYLFVLSLWAVTLVAVHQSHEPSLYFLLGIFSLCVTPLVNPYVAFMLVLGTSGFVLWSVHAVRSLPLETALMPILVIGVSYVVSNLILLQLRKLVDKLFHYQAYAVDSMNLARDRGAELARQNKALRDAEERLVHLNRQLQDAWEVAEEARRLKSQFAANVSHELRTPINLIVGYSEIMSTAPEAYDVMLPPAYRPDILAIYRNARHLQNLINDILDISQLEAESLAIVKDLCAAQDVVLEAVDMMRDMIRSKGLELRVQMPEHLPDVWMDRTRIRQVVLNLLANAVRFTDEGAITVRATCADDYLTIDVIDTGVGMQGEDMRRVFDEFFQVNGDISRRVGGTGLGLALSRKFIIQHGGELTCKSSGIPGQGSTFTFTLPVNAFRNAALVTHNPAWTGTAPRHVLVYDRDPAVLQLFRGYMQEDNVTVCAEVDSALQHLTTRRPNLLVLDSSNPNSRLIEAAHELDISVMQCPMPSGRRAMMTYGIADYLIKPVSRQVLLQTLQQFEPTIQSVLIVDDEPDVTRMFQRMLNSNGRRYRIRCVNSGQAGLDELRRQRPDVLLVDILMPDIDGYTLIEYVKHDDALRNIPIIVVSARGAENAITDRSFGPVSVQRKTGFKPIELVNCVQSLATTLSPPTLQGAE
jgi:signal transduction histidine kinase/DNA-binding response OmpR family regulator